VPTRQWTHREFAFTLQGDIYLRYNSFNNADEMKKEVIRLNPSRFEIGAVYSARVRPLPVPLQLPYHYQTVR
jgi:DNA primase small subunit